MLDLLFTLMFLFSGGCVIGWCMEAVFRFFAVRCRYWMNPGFLTGPCLPLYGFGLCTLYLLASTERLLPIEQDAVRKIVLIVLMTAAMTLIEYIAGVIFIRGMHVQLWDYSHNRGNFQGILCPFYTCLWALAAAAYLFLLHPATLAALAWFNAHPRYSFVIGAFFGILAMDCVYSFHLVARVKALAEQYNILVRYEELKKHIRERTLASCGKVLFLFPLHTMESLGDVIRSYKDLHPADAIQQKIRKLRRKDS